ncbi:unnamed protein product [Mycetohabitans rhizoxinica HKI 454]|uniref:Uncharacterized protein n=1 Tax=Mycetohabitans rhizoxinica (strain DSM 19002 / CIP 109453 / HKI 454) TaxID=882378 RepID=E5ASR5_MYCRK|nr:unnamed protein product [Mycetohabitans rhizoxinica HKI 454]
MRKVSLTRSPPATPRVAADPRDCARRAGPVAQRQVDCTVFSGHAEQDLLQPERAENHLCVTHLTAPDPLMQYGRFDGDR